MKSSLLLKRPVEEVIMAVQGLKFPYRNPKKVNNLRWHPLIDAPCGEAYAGVFAGIMFFELFIDQNSGGWLLRTLYEDNRKYGGNSQYPFKTLKAAKVKATELIRNWFKVQGHG